MATIVTALTKSLLRQAGEFNSTLLLVGEWATRSSKLEPGLMLPLQSQVDKLPVELVQKIWNELVPLLMWQADWKRVLGNGYIKEYKAIVLGSQGAGKSNFATRYIQDQFCCQYNPALEDSSQRVDLVDGHWCMVDIMDGEDWELEWRYGHILKYPDCILLMFSLTSRESFTINLPYWVEEITKHRGMISSGTPPPSDASPCQVVLVGTKSDDVESRCVHREEAEAFAAKLNIDYVECSAKSGDGISKAVHQMVQRMLEYDKAHSWKVSRRNADE